MAVGPEMRKVVKFHFWHLLDSDAIDVIEGGI